MIPIKHINFSILMIPIESNTLLFHNNYANKTHNFSMMIPIKHITVPWRWFKSIIMIPIKYVTFPEWWFQSNTLFFNNDESIHFRHHFSHLLLHLYHDHYCAVFCRGVGWGWGGRGRARLEWHQCPTSGNVIYWLCSKSLNVTSFDASFSSLPYFR